MPSSASPAATTVVSSATLTRPVAVSPRITVTEEIREICKLPLGSVQEAPKFAFDESDLALADYEMLELIGACVARGPLQGRSLVLTGHADVAGTDEYNMALGARRAATVGSYLERFGVPQGHLRKTSRGELDATGTGPAGRQTDRRVDITLAPKP